MASESLDNGPIGYVPELTYRLEAGIQEIWIEIMYSDIVIFSTCSEMFPIRTKTYSTDMHISSQWIEIVCEDTETLRSGYTSMRKRGRRHSPNLASSHSIIYLSRVIAPRSQIPSIWRESDTAHDTIERGQD